MRLLRGACGCGGGMSVRHLLALSLVSLACTLALRMVWYKEEEFSKMRRTLRIKDFCWRSNDSLNLYDTTANGNTKQQHQQQPDPLAVWGVQASGARRAAAHVVLVTRHTGVHKEIKDFMEMTKTKYKIFASEKNFKELSQLKGSKYYLFIFENWRDYFELSADSRTILDNYCRQARAGLIGLAWPGDGKISQDSDKSMVSVSRRSVQVQNLHVHNTTIIRMVKSGIPLDSARVTSAGFNWFSGSYEVLVTLDEYPVILYEPGNVHKIVMARQSLKADWLFKMLLLDSMHYLSGGRLNFPTTRYVQIDIDDIFVGSVRLTKDDVIALVRSQNRLAAYIPGFRYNLGYSGSYFQKGTDQENEGDQLLVDLREKFQWFPHMWRHIQPHKFNNLTEIVIRMQRNKKFGEEHGLDTGSGYSVAPHHSGVFPVHEHLYTAWQQVWGIKVTSTEEYPSLYPARRRRGFVYRNVSVLPRQTCGLFTKNLYYDEYPGGPEKLEQSLAGGELFETVLTNPISVFMTHMPNYCCDRLAPYLFESLLSFISCYTNLNLVAVEPVKLAEKYFSLFPEERKPVWSNPCNDRRHLEIYSPNKSCSQLPDMLIVGPQKTGSTALYSFLKLHPNIVSNEPSPVSFEELQFFNDKNYFRGLDWYRDFFPESNTSLLMFEKSATYFDAENVSFRAHRLLPGGKIVVILIPPEDRAYSWYQHMRAHAHPTALNYTFPQIVKAPFGMPKEVLSLKARCLEPGKYVTHLAKWLTYFRPKQIYVMDGVQLRQDPVATINKLQGFLQVPFVDFKTKLVYDTRKGFYCAIKDGRKKCLGKGKGRDYPSMDEKTRGYLADLYRSYNRKLVELLTQHGYSVPAWLLMPPPPANQDASTP